MRAVRCFGIVMSPFVAIWLLYELQSSFAVLRHLHPLARYVFLTAIAVFYIEFAQNYGRLKIGSASSWLNSIDGRCLSAATIATAFALCFLALLSSWSNGGTLDYSAIGGLLPYSDARDYFDGAEHLLHDGTLTAFNERRPLNAAFFSARLWITQDNFYHAMVLQAVVAAIALGLASLTVSKLYGRSVALVFFAINYAFLDGCLHRTLSEPLGISLGLIALALYVSSIAQPNPTRYGFATFILTLALLTRAGAMFAIASSALFAIFFFSDTWKSRGYALLATIAAVAAGWLVNFLLVRLYGTGGLLLSNFSYTIYGLSQGDKGWTQAIADFPQSHSDAGFLYRKTLESIISHPWLLIAGLAKALRYSTTHFPFDLLTLLGNASDGLSPSSRFQTALVGLLLVPALIYGLLALTQRRPASLDPFQIFLVFQLIGFIASLPFFYEDGGIRLTAATFPFSAAIIAVILAASAHSSISARGDDFQIETSLATGLVLFVTVASLITPRVAKTFEPGPITPVACAANEIGMRIELGDGTTHINVLEDNVESRLPNIRHSDFPASELSDTGQFWATVAFPATILLGYDNDSHTLRTLIGPPGFAGGPRRVASICTTQLSNGVALYSGSATATTTKPP